MRLNQNQISTLSRYFSDVSKILLASTVVGFFVPTGVALVTMPVFLVGSLAAVGFLLFSIVLAK